MFEQRKNERYIVTEDTLKYTLHPFAEDEIFEAEIVNYSQTGICFLSSNCIPPGQEITIRNFMDSSSGTAVVIWSEKSDEDAYKTGLMFVA
jgi:hypothetical protein